MPPMRTVRGRTPTQRPLTVEVRQRRRRAMLTAADQRRLNAVRNGQQSAGTFPGAVHRPAGNERGDVVEGTPENWNRRRRQYPVSPTAGPSTGEVDDRCDADAAAAAAEASGLDGYQEVSLDATNSHR